MPEAGFGLTALSEVLMVVFGQNARPLAEYSGVQDPWGCKLSPQVQAELPQSPTRCVYQLTPQALFGVLVFTLCWVQRSTCLSNSPTENWYNLKM